MKEQERYLIQTRDGYWYTVTFSAVTSRAQVTETTNREMCSCFGTVEKAEAQCNAVKHLFPAAKVVAY
jgi:hypothetical protein